jgi:hypothetical protein
MAIAFAALPAGGNEPATRRIAIVAGNNLGHPEDVELRFAERDASRVAQVLRELGSVRAQDLELLLDRDAAALRAAFDRADAIARESAIPTLLVFYYSGHADEAGLHLGPGTLPWSELKQRLDDAAAGLRIALVDACQSGSLTRMKGFSLGPPIKAADAGGTSPEPAHHGLAVIVASEIGEAAQESLEIGGSFFTHYLVSALRGAADADGDQRVTLAEAHTFTTVHTERATGESARVVQRPRYRFDISGNGDIVLSDLREGAARLTFDSAMTGYLLITEKSTSLVVAETNKRADVPLHLALPAGRYLVHLRDEAQIAFAEVSLPWGGEVALSADDLTATSYQEVAQKGGTLEVHTQRLRIGAGVQSAIVGGMGPVAVLHAGYAIKLAPFELGVRVIGAQKSFDTIDTRVRADLIGAGFIAGWDYPLPRFDVRVWLVGEGQYWRESVAKLGVREAGVFGAGAGAGLRIPIFGSVFAETDLESIVYFPSVEGSGRSERPTLSIGAGFGFLF